MDASITNTKENIWSKWHCVWSMSRPVLGSKFSSSELRFNIFADLRFSRLSKNSLLEFSRDLTCPTATTASHGKKYFPLPSQIADNYYNRKSLHPFVC